MNLKDKMQAVLNNHEFMNLRKPLSDIGACNIQFSTEGIPCYTFEYGGKDYALCNAKYVDEAELIVGNIAFGEMEKAL